MLEQRQISSVLFQTDDKGIVVLDIPRSLEESQILRPSEVLGRRIYSTEPPSVPFDTPEPKKNLASGDDLRSPAAQLAELMTTATVQSALHHLKTCYAGPFCHPRLIRSDDGPPPTPGETVFIPGGAKPLNGTIEELKDKFDAEAPCFNLVVLDPPWPNRSARRTDKYATAFNLEEIYSLLLQIPIASHLAPNALVAIWMSNKPSIMELMTSPKGLLAAWGLEMVTEWTWLKVTASGDPIIDIDSCWRKPWEKLVIAKRVGSTKAKGLGSKVVVAVPDVHSRKPNLRGLFQDILGDEYKGLEVFARCLTAGWWSWGNQVLHLQEAQHWQPTQSSS